jgi:cytochrome c oxidase subunit I
MTTTLEPPAPAPSNPERARANAGLLGWLTTTDHKVIGLSYLATASLFFAVGGVLALLIRVQLAQPDQHLVDPQTYNEFFTMHGSIMIYLFAVPFAFGFANYIVPLHIGAPDVAFPRLNALGYWLYLFGGITMISGFVTARTRPSRARSTPRVWAPTSGSWASWSPAPRACSRR